MANNYTKFSEQFSLENDEQREWVRNKRYLLAFFDGGDMEALEAMSADELTENLEFGEPFMSEVDADGWWIYSEGWSDPGDAATAVHAFMKRFDINKPFVISWCSYCDKPRIGEFFGGMIIVTKDKIIPIDPDAIMRKMIDGEL